jgi:hypothetical protein
MLARQEFGHVSLTLVRRFAGDLPNLLGEIFKQMEEVRELHLPGGTGPDTMVTYSIVFLPETPTGWFELICDAAKKVNGVVEYVGQGGVRSGRVYTSSEIQQMELPNGDVVLIADRARNG